MWSKNGESFLPHTLQRIEQVVPHEQIGQKIFVDDHSTDNSSRIARDFNWRVLNSPYYGIGYAANLALEHVKTENFISVEQDILLAKNWFEVIPESMEQENVMVAEGIRIPTNPILRTLEQYANINRNERFHVSIDNNIYKTEALRVVGGFPVECFTCTDQILYEIITQHGKWVINNTVVSDHIRPSVFEYYSKQIRMSDLCSRTPNCPSYNADLKVLFRIFLTSFGRGFLMSLKTKCPHMFWVYPLDRLATLRACV